MWAIWCDNEANQDNVDNDKDEVDDDDNGEGVDGDGNNDDGDGDWSRVNVAGRHSCCDAVR